MADFSANLKRIRKSENLSQDMLAEKLGVTRQAVSNWERGSSYPDLDMLVQISEALHIDPNDLLYPPAKTGEPNAEKSLVKTVWGKLAIFVFAVGFWVGLQYGCGTDGHYITMYTFNCWFVVFLIGMMFLGIEKIVTLLQESKGGE